MAAKTAVDASKTNAWNIEPERLVLVTDAAHPMYDPRVHLPLDESLVLNVMHHGVIEPVIICKDGSDLVVVDGRQRVKAAREANRRMTAEGKVAMLVTCMIRKGDDASLFGVMVSTNELRTEDTPLGRAEKLQRFLAMGRTEAEAVVVFGVWCYPPDHCQLASVRLFQVPRLRLLLQGWHLPHACVPGKRLIRSWLICRLPGQRQWHCVG